MRTVVIGLIAAGTLELTELTGVLVGAASTGCNVILSQDPNTDVVNFPTAQEVVYNWIAYFNSAQRVELNWKVEGGYIFINTDGGGIVQLFFDEDQLPP